MRRSISDVLGRLIQTLADETKRRGKYRTIWNSRTENGRPAKSGSYLARLESGGSVCIPKLLLVR